MTLSVWSLLFMRTFIAHWIVVYKLKRFHQSHRHFVLYCVDFILFFKIESIFPGPYIDHRISFEVESYKFFYCYRTITTVQFFVGVMHVVPIYHIYSYNITSPGSEKATRRTLLKFLLIMCPGALAIWHDSKSAMSVCCTATEQKTIILSSVAIFCHHIAFWRSKVFWRAHEKKSFIYTIKGILRAMYQW